MQHLLAEILITWSEIKQWKRIESYGGAMGLELINLQSTPFYPTQNLWQAAGKVTVTAICIMHDYQWATMGLLYYTCLRVATLIILFFSRFSAVVQITWNFPY